MSAATALSAAALSAATALSAAALSAATALSAAALSAAALSSALAAAALSALTVRSQNPLNLLKKLFSYLSKGGHQKARSMWEHRQWQNTSACYHAHLYV